MPCSTTGLKMSKEPSSLPSSDQTSIQPSISSSGHADNASSSMVGDSPSACSLNDIPGSKYKFFYSRLYKCLCFLEAENLKILEAVQRKIRLNGEPKRLEELLDDFAFQVAGKKDAYEKTLTSQATIDGQQAFMGRRWKSRYLKLLELVLLLEDRGKRCITNEGSQSGFGPRADSVSNTLETEFFNDVLTTSWDSEHRQEAAIKDAVDDVALNNDASKGRRRASTYEFDDLSISISSVYIQDLLAHHNLYAEEIKHQNEMKCRLSHLLHKTKEQRNQLKKYVSEQESRIQAIEKNIQETEEAILQKKSARATSVNNQDENHVVGRQSVGQLQTRISTPVLEVHEAAKQMQLTKTHEMNKLQSEIKLLECHKRDLEGMLREEEQQRRLLSKRLHDIIGTIHVSCRIKPHPENYLKVISEDKLLFPKSLPSPSGADQGTAGSAIRLDTDQLRCFIFENVVGAGSGHYEIFRKVSQSLTRCLDGCNLCVMTYGPRKSGKTFTMFGGASVRKTTNNRAEIAKGIAQDIVHLLLSLVSQRTEWKYSVYLRAMAVDDERLLDLLKEDKHCFTMTHTLATRDDSICMNIKAVEISSALEFDRFINLVRESERANQNMHLILQLVIVGGSKYTKEKSSYSTIILADLASWEKRCNAEESEMLAVQNTPTGSEANSPNIPTNRNAPNTIRTSTGVNQSLLNLSRVFTALRKRKLPAFKDALLTQILKPVLTGGSQFFLIVTINSDPKEFTSTLASLQFAQNVMQATTKLGSDQRNKRSCSQQADLNANNTKDQA
ncbi:kinesin-like nuclear fusion protein [Clonorchis sinensis]|uniref:Kinesin family member C1 n=2 Tax=Clonorchis sinensis TaxID=79923 RepID=H2KR71_CLOSI|nr:kinesin-like nuclear fusion protein [Clonorchis sinensis]GAA33603.2 kinesin family member C1 [Clonorchis sinensis]